MSSPRFPRTLDDVTVRVVAAEVLVVAVVALATRQPWWYAVLAVDFVLRAGFGPRWSPLARFASAVVRPRLSVAARPTAGPPKRFAAAIGAALTIVAALAYPAGWPTATWVIGAVMVLFPALEAVFGLCVGCVVFSGLMRLGVIPQSVCVECADITRRLSARQRADLADVPQVQVPKSLPS